MGREYYYCSRCQTRLDGEDFDTGHAARIQDQISCEKCLGELIAPLSFKEQEQILLALKKAREAPRPTSSAPSTSARTSSSSIPRVGGPARPHAPHIAPPLDTSRQVTGVFVLGVAILLGALGALYFLFSNPHGEDPVTPQRPERDWVRIYKSEAPETKSAATPRELPTKTPLDKARESVASKAPLETQLQLFEKAAREAEGTDYAETARGERDQARRRLKEAIDQDLAALDKDAKALIAKEEFRRAISLYEQSRLRYESGLWAEAITLRVNGVNAKDAWTAFIPLRDRAVEARKKKDEAEVKAISDRVLRWDLPNFVLELERVLAGGAPPAATASGSGDLKPPTEEASRYQKQWAEAMDLAASRDYDGAAAALLRAAGTLREDAVKAECLADQDTLRLAATVHRESLHTLSSWPRGEKVSFEYFDDSFAPTRVSETFVRADSLLIETVRGVEPSIVELREITPRCLGEIFKSRPGGSAESDGRAAALLCLLEGDADAARALVGGPAESIPSKYWARASKVAESRNLSGDAGKRELTARKLYFTAEHERLQARTRGVAIDRYRTLLNDFADTRLVRSRRAHIAAQRESAKDYVFLADDMTGSGTFKSVRNAKTGTCWASDADSGGFAGKNNTLDFTFYAFPDAPYRCWVYVGGCCAETFVFYLQTTDLTVPHPETKQTLNLDPGASVSVPVKNSITFLKTRHELHGGPKEPKRWEWVSIPLPKYTTAGLKTVRLLTETKGFAVAYAVASSTRSSPPGEAEMKAILKAPVIEAPEPVANVIAPAPELRDPSLVGHWKLDESGPTALDASGNDNTGILVGDPARGPGKFGNGLLFDGKDRAVNIPSSPTLEKIHEGNYTVALWFRPNTKPAGQEPGVNDGSHALLMRGGLTGVRYLCDQRFVLDHALGGSAGAAATTGTSFPPGAFHHVAGVVSRSDGAVRIYVDGKLEGTAAFPAGTAARDLTGQSWKIGEAASGRWATDGAVDDVRIYNRALTPGDIRMLAGAAVQGTLGISISSPAPSERFDAGASLTISAHVTGGDARVARVEFYQGSHLLGSTLQGPWIHAWRQVPSGMYTLTARAVDKAGLVYQSPPVTVRIGNAELYRAINLGGPAVKIDGLQWEAGTARNIAVRGEIVTAFDKDLSPPVDPARATMLRSFVHAKEGTSVALNPVPNGTYQVYLTVQSEGAPEAYDLLIKGRIVQSRYTPGPAGHWERLGPWFVEVPDGTLEVSARGGEASFAGLEVWRVTK